MDCHVASRLAMTKNIVSNVMTKNVLTTICDAKREHIERKKHQTSYAELAERAKETSPVRGFLKSLQHKIAQGKVGLIAEIKKASPSKGVIRADFDPVAIAGAYEAAGAACLSVLTDEPFFQGHDNYLIAARDAVKLPVLRKDFMLDPYQVVEARALGADCILLIMAALEDAQAAELEALAHSYHMDVLVEVHDIEECERALKLKSPLLGVNNRNLKTLEIDLATTEHIAAIVPSEKVLVCESGIYTPSDIARMKKVGAECFLVGESLMKQADIEFATRSLIA